MAGDSVSCFELRIGGSVLRDEPEFRFEYVVKTWFPKDKIALECAGRCMAVITNIAIPSATEE